MLRSIINFYNKFEERILTYSFMFSVVLLFIQIVMRYVVGRSLSWSEELARYIFLWQVWLGTSFAVRENRHIRIDIIPNILKKNKLVGARFELFVTLIWLVFAIFLTYQGFMLTSIQIEINQLSAALRIPMALAYASVPVGCGMMSLRLIGRLITLYKEVK